jgi:glycosyltransferase involved in cell wall biosynthesis
MPGMIRTAFTLPDRHRATGGYQYFINLFRALYKYGGGKVRPVVFVGEEVDAAALAPIEDGAAEIVRSADFSASKTGSRLANALLSGSDRRAAGTYREHAIEVVFESARYHGWRFPFPTIAWLPDFQHRCLPGMFSRRAWLQREIGFRAQIATARIVMLSSESSRADCERFYAGSRGRIRVVPFAAELPPEARLAGVKDAAGKYRLPAQYIYLPNQFWEHKNHRLIIEALKILQQRGVDVTVAASGALADYRHPGLLRQLEARVGELGLQERFRFLGLIPRADVYALMRGAVAVVNPSLFEGWSTPVEEARALGVPLLLSDIPVHREQAGCKAMFFDPHSADSAAGAIGAMIGKSHTEQREPPSAVAEQNQARVAAYVSQVERLIEDVAAGRGKDFVS